MESDRLAPIIDATAEDLTLRQAAFLATLLNDPKVRHRLHYQQRQSAQGPIESVLQGMEERGFVSASETANAVQARLHFGKTANLGSVMTGSSVALPLSAVSPFKPP